MHELVRPKQLPAGISFTRKHFSCQRWGTCNKEKGKNNLFKSKEEIAVPVSIELFDQKSLC